MASLICISVHMIKNSKTSLIRSINHGPQYRVTLNMITMHVAVCAYDIHDRIFACVSHVRNPYCDMHEYCINSCIHK